MNDSNCQEKARQTWSLQLKFSQVFNWLPSADWDSNRHGQCISWPAAVDCWELGEVGQADHLVLSHGDESELVFIQDPIKRQRQTSKSTSLLMEATNVKKSHWSKPRSQYKNFFSILCKSQKRKLSEEPKKQSKKSTLTNLKHQTQTKNTPPPPRSCAPTPPPHRPARSTSPPCRGTGPPPGRPCRNAQLRPRQTRPTWWRWRKTVNHKRTAFFGKRLGFLPIPG